MKWSLLLGIVVLCLSPAHADIICDGVDDLLTTGSPLSAFITATDKTVTAWITLTTHTDAGDGGVCWPAKTLIGDESAYMAIAHRDDGGADAVCVYNYDGSQVQVGTTITLNTPHHIALVHTGGTLSLYLDGTFSASISSGSTAAVSTNVRVCRGEAASAFFGGRIHEIITFPTALSAGELAIRGKSRRSRLGKSTPSAHWAFDQCAPGASGDAVAFRDVSGHGLTLTGDNGGDDAGLTCQASNVLSRWGGMD